MKNTVLPGLAIFLSLSTTAQTNITVKRMRMDSITPIGKSVGEEVSEEIGKDGGKIFSEDSKIQLIFPEGALSKKKKIKIQSVVNHAGNGRGNAYKMEPSGLDFQKPVTLIYYYSDDELNGTLAEFKGMAWQDDKGKWQALPDIVLDTVAKTLTTQINHFSSYSAFDKISLRPAYARVKVEKSIDMEIHFVISDLDNDIALPPTIPASEWSVNGIVNGNSNVGTIRPRTTNYAKYTAPASVPDENPVAVAAKLKGMEIKFNGRTYRDPSLVSYLLIYDKAYRITIDMWIDNSEDGICTMRTEDRGSFTLILEGTRSMIKEISNQNLSVRLNPCRCALIWTNRPVPGPLNFIGASRIDVTPASLPSVPFRKVRIMMKHGFSPMPQFRTACPARMPNPPFGSVFLPPLIEFEAKDEPEQKITLSELSRGAMPNTRKYGMTITIKLIE